VACSGEIVSVIIPALNERDRIGDLILSIYGQDYRPIELALVDGGSTDGTVDTMNELRDRLNSGSFRFQVLHERDFGPLRSPANARNIGIKNSKGKYIAFFDADFVLTDRGLLSKVVEALKEHQSVGVRVKPFEDSWLEYHASVDDVRPDLCSNVHTFCGYRREVFGKVLFDSTLGFYEDNDLNIRAGIRPVFIDAYCRRHFPHDLREWRKQYLWYGKTFRRYCAKYGLNPWLSARWLLGELVLLAMSALAAPFNVGISFILIGLFGWRMVVQYARSPIRRRWRALYILLRQTYAAFWFGLGLLLSYIPHRGASRY